MAHWIVALHENDFKFKSIIRDLRKKLIEMDKNYIKKYNICSCFEYATPNIRELKIVEIDIPEPATENFQKELDGIGFLPFKPPAILKIFLEKMLKSFMPNRVFRINFSDATKARYNHRSFIIAKSSDDSPDSPNHIICSKCNGKYPRDWL